MPGLTEILFYRIVDNEGLFGIGAGFIEEKIKEIKQSGGDILFRINSPGGSVFDGWALVQHLKEAKQQGKKINMIVDGMAASMGGAFLAYADTAQISQLGRIMIHKAYSSYLDPKREDHQDKIQFLQSINKDLHSEFKRIVESRGKDASFLSDIFKSDKPEDVTNGGKQYWFNANEAVNFGLVDKKAEDNPLRLVAEIDLQEKYFEIFNTNKNEVIEMKLLDLFKNKKEDELTDNEKIIKGFAEEISSVKSEIVESVDSKIKELTDLTIKLLNIIEENHSMTVKNVNEVAESVKSTNETIDEIKQKIQLLETTVNKHSEALSLVSSDTTIEKINVVFDSSVSNPNRQKEKVLVEKVNASASKVKY